MNYGSVSYMENNLEYGVGVT